MGVNFNLASFFLHNLIIIDKLLINRRNIRVFKSLFKNYMSKIIGPPKLFFFVYSCYVNIYYIN